MLWYCSELPSKHCIITVFSSENKQGHKYGRIEVKSTLDEPIEKLTDSFASAFLLYT